MAKLVSDCHLSLAYRLGQSAIPSSTTELAKRLNWFVKGLEYALGEDIFWFMANIFTDCTEVSQPEYPYPTDCIKIDQVKVDDYKYSKVPPLEVYDRFEVPLSPVPILPSYAKRSWYEKGEYIYLIPTPSAAATAQTLTSITTSGTTATVTLVAHGYSMNDYLTISGANQAGYNITAKITWLTADTFSYTVASGTTTPATGTLVATENNIIIWGYKQPTMPTSSTSTIVVPDRYEDILVSYAEMRYWSAAHKRGKAADAEGEFQMLVAKLRRENQRRKYGEQ